MAAIEQNTLKRRGIGLIASDAWPLAPVVTVRVAGAALAPVVGAAKVTATPEIGLPKLSFTAATSGFVNAVFTVAL